MKRYIVAVSLGLAAGLLRQSFFGALPAPYSHIDTALILAVMYIAASAGDKAFAAALAAGAVTDALSALPFGAHTVAYAVGIGAAYLLFNGVFTSHDWPGILMISAAGYLTVGAALSASRTAAAILDGGAIWAALYGSATFGSVFAAVLTQLAATAVILMIAARIRARRETWRP